MVGVWQIAGLDTHDAQTPANDALEQVRQQAVRLARQWRTASGKPQPCAGVEDRGPSCALRLGQDGMACPCVAGYQQKKGYSQAYPFVNLKVNWSPPGGAESTPRRRGPKNMIPCSGYTDREMRGIREQERGQPAWKPSAPTDG